MNHRWMSSSFVGALVGFATAVALLAPVPAQALDITIKGVTCAGNWSWDAGTTTLTCASSSTTLVCNPAASPSNPLKGVTSTISANCQGVSGAASYLWSLGGSSDANCPAAPTGASLGLTAAMATPLGCAYTVTAMDGAKSGGGTANVSWSDAPVFACNWSPAPTTAAANGSFPFGVTCNAAPVSSVWKPVAPGGCGSNCTATFGTSTPTSDGKGFTNAVTLPSAGIWTIGAEITGPDSAKAQLPVASLNVPEATRTSGPHNCGSAYANTRTLKVPAWKVNDHGFQKLYTSAAGGLGPNDALVVEITTPATLGTNAWGSMAWDNAGPPRTPRVIVLSDQACDFTRGLDANPLARSVGVPNGSLWYTAGSNTEGYPAMTIPNRTYFVNIKNSPGTCNASACNLLLEFNSPRSQ